MATLPANRVLPYSDKSASANTVTSTTGADVVYGGACTTDNSGAGIPGGIATWLRCSVASATGSATTNAFAIDIKNHADDEAWHTYISGSTFAPLSADPNLNLCSSTGPHELGASSQAWFNVFIQGVYAYQMRAGVASGTATLRVYVTEA